MREEARKEKDVREEAKNKEEEKPRRRRGSD